MGAMEQRVFHGNLNPSDLARALIGEFNHGNLRAQQIGNGREIVVQIASHEMPISGGQTALAVSLRSVADGVSVEIGKQSWLGVAASLGQTAFLALRNPWNLLGRLDDIAQDIENIQLTEDVWRILETTAKSMGASFELSERLRRTVCEYCHTANPVGEPSCIACGAPLGEVQPRTCSNCGFVVKTSEIICPNCGQKI
jgi:DNA-directed RNA polymerase subunit RPC12/RpoP